MWVFLSKFCFFLQVREHATAGNGVVSTLKWCVCVCVLLFSVVFRFYFGQRQIKREWVNGYWCQMGSGCETVDETARTSLNHKQSFRRKSKLTTTSFPSKQPSRYLLCALSYPC